MASGKSLLSCATPNLAVNKEIFMQNLNRLSVSLQLKPFTLFTRPSAKTRVGVAPGM